jgi:hypothetical protein
MRTHLLAGAVTTSALAALVAASPAAALPPGDLRAEAQAVAAPAPVPAPEPAVPTFVNGLAQSVFSTNPADWYSGEVWVQAPFDSDADGRLDRIHADFTAPSEVLTDGLKVPVLFEDSPYYAGTAPQYSNWGVDHELGLPPLSRPPTPFWAAATRARRSARGTSRHGCRAGSRSCTRSRRAPATPTAARPPAARTRR